MKYIQIKTTCLSRDLEQVCAVVSMLDSSLMIEDYSDIDQLDTCYGELIDETILNADKEHAAVSFFLPEDGPVSDSISFLRERFAAGGIAAQVSVAGVDEADWENEWRKYYHPVHIGRAIVIVPAWQEYAPAAGEVCVRMDPGLAFGTGTHESTRLCAVLLEKYLRAGDRVLDVGTGSGILAICAKKLGANEVSGCDIDPVAVRVARENAADNDESISFFVSDLLSAVKGEFDLVIANIVADIIVRMAPDVPCVLAEGGRLIVSGVIAEREDEVVRALAVQGLSVTERREENDWRALVFEKK